MTKISRFAIRGLYNERDIEIPFQDNVKILVAENGYGKTTVLNALYALVSGDTLKLQKIDFRSMELELSTGKIYQIEKEELAWSKQPGDFGFFGHMKHVLGGPATTRLMNLYLNSSRAEVTSHSIHNAAKKMSMPTSIFKKYLSDVVSESSKDGMPLFEEQSAIQEIQEVLGFDSLYLPTYRRVEQDIRDVRFSDSDDETLRISSINFGMSDVSNRIKEVTQEIINSSVEWFSKVNGEMLSQLVEGFRVDPALRTSVRNSDAVEIVLKRIGSNISSEHKLRIMEMVESGEIENNHDPLVYFISNLLKVYEQQKENDKSIQDFTEVCNRYLTDKKFEYDEGSVSLRLIRRKTENEVDIETLSSGEKQIISLFCNLYLRRGNNYAIFFDEPELSLSIEWQKTLLPDVIASGKCAFLFATTHSPFIFENDLANKAVDLGTYIKEL